MGGRGCLTCGAFFKVMKNGKYDDESTLAQVEEHLAICTKETPFLDDENAIRYEEPMPL